MKLFLAILITSISFIFSFCSQEKNETITLKEPQSSADLGELLFFDPILSSDSSVSCASCHKPQFGFADNVPLSFGVDSIKGNRNTPSAMNLGDRFFFFHDGRAESLEEQVKGPIENPIEMNLPLSVAIERIKKHKQYNDFFIKLFKRRATVEDLTFAIAEYERSLETADTPFDDYMAKVDTHLFTESAKRGRLIFNHKAKCFDCHFGPDFTADQFRNIGLFDGKTLTDSGRFLITRKPEDLGKFKTPGLRNVLVTAPYMHNGMFKTLREVIDYYDNPNKVVAQSINRDTLLSKPLNLSEQEKKDLENFLVALTDRRFAK
jgi:cytochrome c peroxidase